MEALKKFKTISSSHYNNWRKCNGGRKYDCGKRSQNFLFNFDLPKNVDQNVKHETEFITKSNESLAENKTKSKID